MIIPAMFYFAHHVSKFIPSMFYFITKTHLFQYKENFTFKNWKFSDKKLIFFIFLLKT